MKKAYECNKRAWTAENRGVGLGMGLGKNTTAVTDSQIKVGLGWLEKPSPF
jgi:hypothetical protein